MKEDKIRELEGKIKYHKTLYYQGNPEISDLRYDKYEKELRKLDPKNKILKEIYSTKIGSKKIRHSKKMLSLDKTYELSDLEKWIKGIPVVSTYKIDGVSCSLIYINGKLDIAKTRGDGKVGEDITDKIIWVDIPSRVEDYKDFEVRGELFCYEKNFCKLSETMEKIGLEKPSSPRNIVSGLISRKDEKHLCGFITFKAFDLISDEIPIKKELDKYDILKSMKFDIPEYKYHSKIESIEKLVKEGEQFLSKGEYDIDGIVFTYNSLEYHNELGETTHHPRYKIAFKYKGETAESKILNIEWNVSRNGILTPVGIINPINLSGAKISRVTLHNYGIVKQQGFRKNDMIKIIRSGEVIPKFLEVTKKSKENAFHIPDRCPSCKKKIRIIDIRLICNNKKCVERVKKSVLNFIQKTGMKNLNEKRIDALIDANIVNNVEDIFNLTKDKLFKIDKIKEKTANNILEGIDNIRKIDFATFLSAFGIKGLGLSKCEKIVHSGYNNISKLKLLTSEKLSKIEGFASKSSEDVVQSLKLNIKIIEKLAKEEFKFTTLLSKNTLYNKNFCITGKLSVNRSDIEKIIKNNGGKIVSSVSHKTDYLLANSKIDSSKYKKAIELKITVINEENLMKLISKKK